MSELSVAQQELLRVIEWGLFGTTDGELLDDDVQLPVGELRRLLRSEVMGTLAAREEAKRLTRNFLSGLPLDGVAWSDDGDLPQPAEPGVWVGGECAWNAATGKHERGLGRDRDECRYCDARIVVSDEKGVL